MIIEIKIPAPGESITEVEIATWLVENNSFVEKDQEIAEIESDKASFSLIAEESGKINILIAAEQTAEVGKIACTIDNQAEDKNVKSETTSVSAIEKKQEIISQKNKIKTTPLAKKIMQENNLSVDDIINGLKKIAKKDVEQVINYQQKETKKTIPEIEIKSDSEDRKTEKKRMSLLRRKLGERLVSVKNETAMLTTFNELDMSKVIALRKQYKQSFIDKHGVKLGFMSFFTKATSIALRKYPELNAMINGENIVSHNFCDIGIAVQTTKGLIVPILRDVEKKSLPQIEKEIFEIAQKARDGKISIDELSGGTFTITNGGVFGSLLSTPILNPPQSGILGMHNIMERPIAVNGKVEIRPMMYLALSYDHRIIDGKTSVGFLLEIKRLLENPENLIFENKTPEDILFEF